MYRNSCFSIDHEILQRQVSRVIGDSRLLTLIANIVDSHHDGVDQHWPPGGELFDVRLRKRGLPIGNLTSQFLANVYLHPLDEFVKHELRVKVYVRYLDDFVLFGRKQGERKAQARRVRENLGELRLSMHPDKYRLLPTALGVGFVGYVVFAGGRVRVRSSMVRRCARRYRQMLWKLRRHRHLRSIAERTAILRIFKSKVDGQKVEVSKCDLSITIKVTD